MLLKTWLETESIKTYQFARDIGIAPGTLYRNLNGTHRMSSRYAVLVEKRTGGAVSRAEAVWPEHYVDEKKLPIAKKKNNKSSR